MGEVDLILQAVVECEVLQVLGGQRVEGRALAPVAVLEKNDDSVDGLGELCREKAVAVTDPLEPPGTNSLFTGIDCRAWLT